MRARWHTADKENSFQRDGFMAVAGNGGSQPNYPSTLQPYEYKPVDVNQEHEKWVGQAVHNLQPVGDEDYVQANMLWEMLGKKTTDQQDHLVHNVASHLFAAIQEVRERSYDMFARVNSELGRRIREATEEVRSAANKQTAKAAALNHANHLL
jgi:catalase